MRTFVYLSYLLLKLWSLECQKLLIFCIFCWCQQKISHNFHKIFTWIWKILCSSLRKCCRLLGSGLTLARYQPFKIHSFIIFFFDISTLDISQTVIPKMSHFFSFFAFQDLQNSVHCLLTWISFFYIKFPNFCYMTCSVPNLIPIWS